MQNNELSSSFFLVHKEEPNIKEIRFTKTYQGCSNKILFLGKGI